MSPSSGLVRDGKRRFGTGRNLELRAGDILVLEAAPDALDEFRSALKLDFAPEGHAIEDAVGEGVSLVEMVVPEGSRIAGRSAQAIGLGWRKRTVLMGISRKGTRLAKRLRRTTIQPGDILLLLVPSDTGADVVDWLGGHALADRGLAVTRDPRHGPRSGSSARQWRRRLWGCFTCPLRWGLWWWPTCCSGSCRWKRSTIISNGRWWCCSAP